MKTTTVTKLKASLSACLNYVKAGSRLLITEHDEPIAVIYPYGFEGGEAGEYVGLVKSGLLSPPRKAKEKGALAIKPIDIGDSRDRVIKALRAEREGGW